MITPVNLKPQNGATSSVGSLLRDNALPRLEISLLLAYVLGCSRESVLANTDRTLDRDERSKFDEIRQKRLDGMPIAYLLGRREFFGLDLHVGPSVLIPRPETEELVAAALAHLPAQTAARVLDLGTGSGAVAIAIAHERRRASVEAVDIDPAALAVASANAARLGLKNVHFRQADWFSGAEGVKFDLIAGNPPYVDAADPHLAQGDVVFEPRHALTPGPDGLAALRSIVGQAPAHLVPGGWLLLEHGYDQGEPVRALFVAAGLVDVATRADLAGIGRVTSGRLPTAASS